MYKRLQRFLKFHLPPTLTSLFKMHILSCELVTGAPMEDVLEAMQGMTQKSNLCFGAFWGPHILSLIFDDNGFPILSRMGCSTCRWLCMFLFLFFFREKNRTKNRISTDPMPEVLFSKQRNTSAKPPQLWPLPWTRGGQDQRCWFCWGVLVVGWKWVFEVWPQKTWFRCCRI